jgi:hypothetical protein
MDHLDRRRIGGTRSLDGFRFEPATTLFDLVAALRGTGATDLEVVATVTDLVARGRLRLTRPLDETDFESIWAVWPGNESTDPTNRSYKDRASAPQAADERSARGGAGRKTLPNGLFRSRGGAGTARAIPPVDASHRGAIGNEGDES